MLWIRSQDQYTLVNAGCIEIDKDNNLYKIYAWAERGAFFEIGNYSTEAKALKVLDRIHKYLNYYIDEKECHTIHRVFQMPLDSEVEEYD